MILVKGLNRERQLNVSLKLVSLPAWLSLDCVLLQ